MTTEIEKMRIAGNLAKQLLDHLANYVDVGVSTDQLNSAAAHFIAENNAISACLNYQPTSQKIPFPKHICTSVNHVACHGIPNDKKLKDGDSLNIDVTVIVDGYHGDTSRMFFAGKPKLKHQRVSDAAYDIMMKTIETIRPGMAISEIGKLGEELAKANHTNVIKLFCGHGIGKVFHAPPLVVNFNDPKVPDWNYILKEGEFITVEPITTTGKGNIRFLSDGWTAVTTDQEPTAQWEHTIAVVDGGFEIMTL